MQKRQLIRARGARWYVADTRAYDDCTLIVLEGAEAATFGETRSLLLPFDDIETLEHVARARRVSLRRWRRACRALIASATPPGGLTSAVSARMDILPHQLEPALAVVRGRGCRVLLADDVGLGKTVQAGLIVAELLERKWVERVLVLTPSGIRSQWIGELRDRFGVDACAADARSLRQLSATLAVGMNPWTAQPVAVASIDYVKRPEVLPAAASCRWDMLLVDEAHGVAGDSDRRRAVEDLAARASYVILLSATPHSGDDEAFDRLCAIGSPMAAEPPLLVFRRTRRQIRPQAERRVTVLHVRPTRQEIRMFAALDAYRQAVRTEHGSRELVLSVLTKRAYSSPWALASSVERRLKTLEPVDLEEEQLPLPLDEDGGDREQEDAPPEWPAGVALSDVGQERRLLTVIVSASIDVLRGRESKLAALGRFLRRTREPALIFTEYRDTAAHLQDVLGRGLLLHGGLSARERDEVVARFDRDVTPLLIATDAAAQGLNLQRGCRLVVNLELPWNPMRLEQRIGRVDRIGQSRRVHAVHLVGRRTGEEAILERLGRRVARAKAAIDAPDPIHRPRSDVSGASGFTDGAVVLESPREAARVIFCRSVRRPLDREALVRCESTPWWVARARSATRVRLGCRALLLYQVSLDDAFANAVASTVVGVSTVVSPRALERAQQRVIAELVTWSGEVKDGHEAVWRCRLDRERAILRAARLREDLFQPALFDRRVERERMKDRAQHQELIAALQRRLAHCERQAMLGVATVRLLLALQP